jgi:serine/threonine-protein kinase
MSSDPLAKSSQAKMIGRYRIVKRIGAGGMGAVYKAIDVELGREVALKVLPPDLAAKPDQLERFRREALHSGKLRHEHIVTLYEFGETNGVHYLAMEYVDGCNLHEYIHQRGRLGPEEARQILIQAAQALTLAHQQGIVHRDIKPSNFLLTNKDGHLCLKLTDFGVALNLAEDEFKVTRTGTTIGTVDYISPEQARNSRAADIRSDIYSLGCTLYHMLAGKAPFSEGEMTERLLKHLEARPEDVRKYNSQVPASMVTVLNRMLEKKPENRYQTPKELLKDLQRAPNEPIVTSRELLEGLALAAGEKRKTQRQTAPDTRKQEAAEPTRPLDAPEADPLPKLRYRKVFEPVRKPKNLEDDRPGYHSPLVIEGWKAWTAVISGIAVVILIALALAFGWGRQSSPNPPRAVVTTPREEPKREEPPPKAKDSGRKPVADAGRKPAAETAKGTEGTTSDKSTETKPERELRRIYQPPPGTVETVRDEFATRRAAIAPLPNLTGGSGPKPAKSEGPVYTVSRFPVGKSERHFISLAEACNKAPAQEGTTTIEINDNGPLFELPVAVSNRNLIIRAGKGYRPLIAWNIQGGSKITSAFFFSVTQGSIWLENIDMVVRADSGTAELAGLIRVEDGTVRAEGCAFSVAGRSANGFSAIQLDGSPRSRCQMDRCYVRGADVTALNVQAAGAEVLVESCLLAGGNRPLVEVLGRAGATPTVLRVAHSTLVAGQTLLRVRPATKSDKEPAVYWVGWDALLARYAYQPGGGEMVDLQEETNPSAMKWRAINCLYAGWQTLLRQAKGNLFQNDLSGWRSVWGYGEGDQAAVETWPAALPLDPSETSPATFRATGTHVAFAATSGSAALGCDVSALPALRETWLTLTYDRYVPPLYEAPGDQPPEIPTLDDGLYHGERLDLTRTNLGEHLQAVQKRKRLGPRVVLHLFGQGEAPTAPIRVHGSSLVLYFVPPLEGRKPLELVPEQGAAAPALIDVEDGSCEMTGGAVRLSPTKDASLPQYCLKVRGGNLRLHSCRLQGPFRQGPAPYLGLIDFAGSGETAADRARDCSVVDSLLLSGTTCIHSTGIGARVRLQNCVVVAGGGAFHLEPGTTPPTRLNAPYILEHNTVAAHRAVFRLSDTGPLAAPVEPIVVQARANLFLAPISGGARQSGLVVFEGDALARGLMVWQGDANGFDKQMVYYVAAGQSSPTGPPQSPTLWQRIWGPGGERRPFWLDLPPVRLLEREQPKLDRLPQPSSLRLKTRDPPGADLEVLGILRKTK